MSRPIEDRDPGDEQASPPENFNGWELKEITKGWWCLSRDGCKVETKIIWTTIGVAIDGDSGQFPSLCDFPSIAGIERLLELRRTAIAKASARA